MIEPELFIKFLKKNKINFYCGVPDSCVAPFVSRLKKNFVLANEGTAVAFGSGYYLATKKTPLVYFQNSGLGNATDPLTNLINQEVYGLPMILMIGWRGHPLFNDEPQHIIQGRILKKTLNSYGIRFEELKNKSSLIRIEKLISHAKKESKIVAILVNKKSFKTDKIIKNVSNNYKIHRGDFLLELLNKSSSKDKIFSSVGFNSREIYQLTQEKKIKKKIFYLIGGMGHTAAIALGNNIFDKRTRNTICIDGDGSFLMHLGSIVNSANFCKKNFKYLVFKNDKHESVGNINLKFKMDFKIFSKSIGFKKFLITKKNNEIKKNIQLFLKSKESTFHVVYVKNKTFNNLLRVKNLNTIKSELLK